MRKLLLALMLSACLLPSCNDAENADGADHHMTDTEKQNLAAAQRIADAFDSGNKAAIDSFVADDFVDHTDRGDLRGKDRRSA